MASGFVSAGGETASDKKDESWIEAHQAVEASRRRLQEGGRQEGGKSLYEVLQQNKTAKQEAFEESLRLKNQFRTLDEDEVDFLDNVLESTRAREEEVQRETAEGLETFRKKREAADQAVIEANIATSNSTAEPKTSVEEESWVTSNRKRRRANGRKDVGASKSQKKSTETTKVSGNGFHSEAPGPKVPSSEPISHDSKHGESRSHPHDERQKPELFDPPEVSAQSSSIGSSALGLGAYSSDEE